MKLHIFKNKWHYLKVLMIDGISMIGKETFGHLDRVLKAIIHNSSPFGGVSLLVVGNFFTTFTC